MNDLSRFAKLNKTKKDKTYDTVLTRLVSILTRLNNGERLRSSELAKEFNVDIRTIQTDLNHRLSDFPIGNDGKGTYFFYEGSTIDKSFLTIEEMIVEALILSTFRSSNSYISSISNRIFKKLLLPNIAYPFFVKGEPIEEIDLKSQAIAKMEEAIQYSKAICITTANGNKSLHPHKIVSFDGIWYLMATDTSDQKIKNFMLSKITGIEVLKNHFIQPKNIEAVLERIHSAWFQDGVSFEVEVKITPEIAHYFKQRKHLSSQKIVKENKDGSLNVAFEVSHEEDVDNLIKSWLPHIEVIRPAYFRDRIAKELADYLKKYDSLT